MTTFGIDYAGARPSPTCLKNNGVHWVGRYLEPASDWKTLKRPEADALRAAGISIVGFYETTAGRSLKGYQAGVEDAKGVNAHRSEVGMPADRPVYFAVDIETSASQLSGPITAYFKGIASVMPLSQIGAYGGYKTIKYVLDHKLVGWAHQTYAWSRLNPKTLEYAKGAPILWDERAHIQQYRNGQSMCGGAGDVDFNRGMVDDFGQWPIAAAPKPPTPPSTGETVNWNPSASTVSGVKDAPPVAETVQNKWNDWALIALLKSVQKMAGLPITGKYDQATADVVDSKL